LKKKLAIKKAEPPPAPPRLRFCGVVLDSSGSLAIVEGPDGRTNLVREGETVDGVVILSVQKKILEYRFGREKFRLELSP
jgi:hypothetical protein